LSISHHIVYDLFCHELGCFQDVALFIGATTRKMRFNITSPITEKKVLKTNRTGLELEPSEKGILCQESCFFP
jgi:hypothetical protein